MKKRDKFLITIELLFTLSFLGILGYMLDIPSGKVVSYDTSLSNYPSPFYNDNNYNFIFATSDDIKPEEYSCAISILSGMKNLPLSTQGDNVPLGSGISNNFLKSSITNLPSLQDTSVSLAGNSINVHDEINLGKITSSVDTSSPSIETSLTKSKGYESDIYLDIKSNSLSYHYIFENTVDLSQISPTNQLTINFLGSELTISEIISDTEFKAALGIENLLKAGDSLSVDGKTLTVYDIGLNSIVVDVDGNKEVISEGSTEGVEGIQVSVRDILYNDANSVTAIIAGKTIVDRIKDGQTYGDCSSECFVWDINNLLSKSSGDIYTDGGPTIGIKNSFSLTGEISESNCVEFPNKFTKLCFEATNIGDYSNYYIFKDSIDLSNAIPQLSSQNVITISTGHQDGIDIDTSNFLQSKISNKRTSEIYLRANSSDTIDVFYEENSKIKWAGTYSAGTSIQIASVRYDKTSGNDIKILSAGTLSNPDIIFSPSGEGITNDDITIQLNSNLNGINGLTYGADSKDISNYDTDQRSQYGIIISDIQNGISDDQIELRIPSDQVKAKIEVESKPEVESKTNIPSILAGSEITDINNNIIAIGKDNAIYSKLVLTGWDYQEGQAVINLVTSNNYKVLLVAGTTLKDLERACNILANFNKNKDKLKGIKTIV